MHLERLKLTKAYFLLFFRFGFVSCTIGIRNKSTVV